MSSFECDRLLKIFRKSINATLHTYRPRLSKLHSNLIRDTDLMVTGLDEPGEIDVVDEVQIAMYAGSMYFESEDEQNAYCGFLGLIPRPRTQQQEQAFESGIIKAKGYVPIERRKFSEAVSDCVGRCKFHDNPVDLVIKLIEAHHQTMLKESHVASILERGIKLKIDNATK